MTQVTKPSSQEQPDPNGGPILLYDGECGVCSSSVQWILAHERAHHLRFAAIESRVGRQLRSAGAVDPSVDSLIWVEQETGRLTARIWSDAVLAVLSYVGGPWRALTLFRFVPSGLRDAAYRLFARNRTKWSPRSCLLPAPGQRGRFLND